jgi:signal transduction histidine kinase/CheY-like chemotaxis protein
MTERGAQATIDPGAGPLPAASQDRLRAEQLLHLCNNWVRAPLPIAVVSAAIVYIVWPYATPAVAIGWAVITVGALIGRRMLCRRLVATGALHAQPRFWARAFPALNLVNGSLAGSPAYLFFPWLPPEGQALLTTLLGGWGAAAIAATGPYVPAYYTFVATAFAPLVISWALAGGANGAVIAILLFYFAIMMMLFARELNATVERSIGIRFRNESLIDLLRRANEQAEAARRHAEDANKSKSRFLAAAAHDLSQPLHALTLLTGLLNARAREPDQREIASSIGRAVESLDNLFTELLDLSRLDAGVVVPTVTVVAVRHVIEGLSEEYRSKAAAKGLAFSAEACDGVIATDYLLLERVLRNLLENAIRYTERGRVSVACRRIGDEVAITVADSGIGIPAAEQARIFDEFYQIHNPARDRRKGLGLGLAIVQRLVHRLGHRLELESAPGEGSRFTVRIAASDAATPAAAAPGLAAATPPDLGVGGATVLVIDDEPEVTAVVSLLLEEWRCRPIPAGSLAEARARLQAEDGPPDLMLVDYRLANGENGIAAIETLHRELGFVPAILVTGDTASEQLLEFEDAGYPVLHKPVKTEELQALMHRLLQKGYATAS